MYRARAVEITNRESIKRELVAINCDKSGALYMAPKGVFRVIKLENVGVVLANIIKQEMLSKGGEAAVTRGVLNHSVEKTDILLMGTVKQYQKLVQKLKMQPFGAKKMAAEIERLINNLEGSPVRTIKAREYDLILGKRTLIQGILNVTPDSFSDGGRFNSIDLAIEQAHRMVEEGADIIDLGGESTRPNYERISDEEELGRIIPVIKRLVREVKVPISIDTYKAEVAKGALEEGAHIINDIWGLRAEPKMAKVIGDYDAAAILMHNQTGTIYHNLIGDMITFFEESLLMATEAGADLDKMILDPGVGFGKDTDQNLEVMRRLDEFKALGQPMLLGTSRKSMIGNTLNLPVNERVEGTGATIAVGIVKGVDIVRVHDVKEMTRVAKMTDAMIRR